MHKLLRHLDLACFAILFVFTSVAFLSYSPYRVSVPHRDSGIFLNVGANLLDGKMLYQETWDNKQPLLYVLNALGLWLGNGSVWGVWALELVLLLVMVFLGYRMLRLCMPPMGSFFAVSASFLTIYPWIAGNYTEEYAIVFQAGILAALFLLYLPNRTRASRVVGALSMGVLAGLSFCIKQTYIDTAAAVGLFLLFLAWLKRDRAILGSIALMVLGFMLVNGVFILYFAANGALNDYITSAYLFNSSIANLGLLEWIHSLLERLELLTATPFLLVACAVWLAVILGGVWSGRELFRAAIKHPLARWVILALGLLGWALFLIAQVRGSAEGMGLLEWLAVLAGSFFTLAALVMFLRKPSGAPFKTNRTGWREALEKGGWSMPGAASLLFLGLIDLPIVVLSITLSGRDFFHYYISLYPALFLLLGGGAAYLYQAVPSAKRSVLNTVLAALLIAASFGPLLQIWAFLANPGGSEQRSETAQYLNAVTAPGDPILVWGWESVIYYLADRQAPTRYEYQFAAYQQWEHQQDVQAALLTDMQNQPPVYIADLMDGGMPLIEGRNAETCLSGSTVEHPRLLEILSFVCSNYAFDRRIGQFNIYRLRSYSAGE